MFVDDKTSDVTFYLVQDLVTKQEASAVPSLAPYLVADMALGFL